MPLQLPDISRQIRRIKNKLYFSLSMILAVLSAGTLGFRFLSDDYSWTDALYMTVITVTTVGFGEVHPPDERLKLFTVVLIIVSIVIYGFVISVFTEILTDGNLLDYYKKRKIQRKINQMKKHVIVCGYGRNGKQAVDRLIYSNTDCIVIENDPAVIEKLEEKGITYVKGDATRDETLQKARIDQASHLITALPSDADNLFVVLSARQLNENISIISRASDDSSYGKLKIAGADNIIMPDKIGGNHMASLIVTPDLVEFVERLTLEGGSTMNLEEIAVDDLPREYVGKTLNDLDIRRKTGCLVIGLKIPDKRYIINPDASVKLLKGSRLIILGNTQQIQELHKVF